MNKLFLTTKRANEIRENGKKEGISAMFIGVALIGAFAALLFKTLAGGQGANVVGATTLNSDKVSIIKTADAIKTTQVRFNTNNGIYASNIAAPFVLGLDGSPAIQTKDGFTDLTKKKDGTMFDYEASTTYAAAPDSFYIEKDGVKFYTQPSTTNIVDNFGESHPQTSVMLYIDMTAYNGTLVNRTQLENDVCDELKKEFGHSRVQCGGTEPVISDFASNRTKEIDLTVSQASGVEGMSDGDGLITITITDKEAVK